MLQETTEPAWVDAFEAVLARCALRPGDGVAMYDKRDFNGTGLRAFAGNFLCSTGADEAAGRYTRGHFDLPLRNCTVEPDGVAVVEQGRVAA